MAKYFNVSPSSAEGNHSVTVTPKTDFTGAGKVSEAITFTAKNDASKKATINCSRQGKIIAFDITKCTISSSPTLDGTYTKLTPKVDNASQVSMTIPATATYIKVLVPAFNDSYLGLGNGLYQDGNEFYAKIFGGWMTDDMETLSPTRVQYSSTTEDGFTPTGNPGLLAATTIEVWFKIEANIYGYGVKKEFVIVSSSDSGDLYFIFNQTRSASTMSVSPTTMDFGTSLTGKDALVSSNDEWTAS
ncbi:hypothetical protein [Bacteroides reticulotermitis]|uniref:hypothetical protein n=1 Tax=Bacteroides reticulotermitis TaxID=1133319 RepID=UPI003A83B7D4